LKALEMLATTLKLSSQNFSREFERPGQATLTWYSHDDYKWYQPILLADPTVKAGFRPPQSESSILASLEGGAIIDKTLRRNI
jgi:hypothetical protein